MTKIGVVQLVSSQDRSVNMARLESLIPEAAAQGARAIFLPENFGALAANDVRSLGDDEAGESRPLRRLLSDLAERCGCWIFAGTIPCSVRPDGGWVPGSRVRAASFVFDANGIEQARYDKIHMFDVDVADNQRRYEESSTFEPGESIEVVATPFGQVGLSVCYDIRFPELYRELFYRGAEVIAVPSAFTRPTGEAHFEVLLRARAIESFSFVVAACQGGEHDSGRQTYGHSMVVDPWGEVICRAGEGEAILYADIDVGVAAAARQKMPVLEQRRIFNGTPLKES